jgi:nucleotide-binding universal stress UspA family protein
LLGSVSNEVLHAAGVPVMIVKGQDQGTTDSPE